MGRKTISLENSAYSKLKAAKRTGESFSDVIHRLLDRGEPSLLEFSHPVSKEAADQVAEAVMLMRSDDLKAQRQKEECR